MGKESVVEPMDNGGTVSTKPKEASQDGLKNYFVSNADASDALPNKGKPSVFLITGRI